MASSDVVRVLRERLARAEPRVTAAYLFGSSGRGDDTATSDLDLAVLLRGDAPRTLGELPLDLVADLEGATGRRVDLVILNGAPADLVIANAYPVDSDSSQIGKGLWAQAYLGAPTVVIADRADALPYHGLLVGPLRACLRRRSDPRLRLRSIRCCRRHSVPASTPGRGT